MERTYINEAQKAIGGTVKVQGFIENLRNSKYMAFIVLKDITGKLQITVEKADHPELVDTIDQLTPDSVITVTGKVMENDYVKMGGVEMIPATIEVENEETLAQNEMTVYYDAIPDEMIEAASIDGASNTRQFLTITIPLLGPVLQMVLMNAILGSLKVTDLVLTLTNGKPSGKTEVMMTYIYKKFFGDGGASGLDFGYGAALTVVTAVILGIVTLIYLRATKKSSDVY